MGQPNNGAHVYAKNHEQTLKDHLLAFESDLGTTRIFGFGVNSGPNGKKIVENIVRNHLRPLNITKVYEAGIGEDTVPLHQKGIPAMINLIDNGVNDDYYFTFHHSAGDTMTVLNPDQMDGNVVGIASMFYIIADMEERFPRD